MTIGKLLQCSLYAPPWAGRTWTHQWSLYLASFQTEKKSLSHWFAVSVHWVLFSVTTSPSICQLKPYVWASYSCAYLQFWLIRSTSASHNNHNSGQRLFVFKAIHLAAYGSDKGVHNHRNLWMGKCEPNMNVNVRKYTIYCVVTGRGGI